MDLKIYNQVFRISIFPVIYFNCLHLFNFKMNEDDGICLNFHRVDSIEIIYPNKTERIKKIGQYILGDKIGEGKNLLYF